MAQTQEKPHTTPYPLPLSLILSSLANLVYIYEYIIGYSSLWCTGTVFLNDFSYAERYYYCYELYKRLTILLSPAGMSLTKLLLFPARQSLASDIPAREEKIANLFYSVALQIYKRFNSDIWQKNLDLNIHVQ